ncbi:MAG: M23 family metallopeptidase [Clostridia bacterium]
MDNIVSSRRLRKSMIDEIRENSFSELEKMNISTRKYNKKSTKIMNKIGLKTKFLIKVFICIFLVFICLIGKLLFYDVIKSNNYARVMISEYKKDYSKEYVLEKVENISNNVYKNIKYIIPEQIYSFTVTNYKDNIKPKILSFDLLKVGKRVLGTTVSKKSIKNENKEENKVNVGIGGGEPLDEKKEIKAEEISSEISIMEEDILNILDKKISIIKPVNGTVTSVFGAREEIFKGVNSYHTGIDIANKLATPIISATSGEVITAKLNDKYYGNYVEIKKDDVIFKYGHMINFNVKVGDIINQSDVIGNMGSSGMSTGSHLHFEIKINGRSVDPQRIIEIK